MSESYVCELLASVLVSDGKPSSKTLSELIKGTGLSRVTILKYVKRLKDQGLIAEKPLIHGRGRPRLLFQPTQPFLRMISTAKRGDETVLIRFERLKTLCKHMKGGRCKQTLKLCYANLCPSTIK
jgi:DNA-binding transcriptional regulator GbsR (MarR family)